MRFISTLTLAVLSLGINAQDNTYQKPPKEILELIDIKPLPTPYINKNASKIVYVENADRMSLEMLAEPELKLAGLRINPRNHNKARVNPAIGISIMDLAANKKIPVTGLPEKLAISSARYSPLENYFSFVNCMPDKLELWVIDLKTNAASKVKDAVLSATLVSPYYWTQNEEYIYFFERVNTKPYPEEIVLPTGPAIQESGGKKSTIRTYQDLLKNKTDENKFDFYATTRIGRYAPKTGTAEKFAGEKTYTGISISPDGNYILTYEIKKPYSYLLPYGFFPSSINALDKSGKIIKELSNKPLQDNIPQGFDACEAGMRDVEWRDDMPSTIIYAEAQDGGDPKKEVAHRDYIYTWDAPFTGKPNQLAQTVNRYQGISFSSGKTAIMSDGLWKTRNAKVYLLDLMVKLGQKVIFDYSTEDAYKLPGNFVMKEDEKGNYLLMTDKKMTKLYLQGAGYSPEGKKAFIDEYEIASGKTKRLWQADGKTTLEQIVKIVDIEKGDLITRIESQKLYPNYYKRNFRNKKMPTQITTYENPYKSIAGISKEKIEYTREDGVKLFGTLYLPAGYDKAKDGKLPMLVHAYPTEFKDDKAAGQIKDSPHEFTFISWASPIYWVNRGFAVLDNAQFPIIGKGEEEPNDTYITQLVANGRAAIKAVSDMGVCDTHRVAVMGHSYGAFMTANLLAHSNLFAAGIARSGAYNRTLTPFGFQSEERTYWQAQDVYNKMAPFNYADKINEPLLMIHGDADNNPGTFTLQSERLFQAVKGLGGTARLVLLPYESHSYAAKENVFHMLWEMDTWLTKYVKERK
ncbi:MAG TPA: prolyl oligopeptidase family serine peptidase [Flavobacteriales bacterium]|nr:prolyl oligopeptidase family serine peptidase [Flavobacteriales bacterium]